MRRIPTFEEFVSESEIHVDEAVNIQDLAHKAGSSEATKSKLMSALKKQAPSLADDENFMKQFMKSIESPEEEEVSEK